MFISTFRDVMKKAERRGFRTRWYKDLEEDKIYDLVGSFDWTGEVYQGAARILSGTIVRHPFPNGNHRSSLALMLLLANGRQWPAYSLKGRGEARLYQRLVDGLAGAEGAATQKTNTVRRRQWVEWSRRNKT